jgi:hypothetical protein
MLFTNTVVMVRPHGAAFNPETAGDNRFQVASDPAKALEEWDQAVFTLREAGVTVLTLEAEADLPDAAFPNNWFSTHRDGKLYLFPMRHPSRANERSLLPQLREQLSGFQISEIVDLSPLEETGRYLEGTGSLVLDRKHRIAYAALSPRTDKDAVWIWCQAAGYQPFMFETLDAIYHTNVVMGIGDGWAVVCTAALADPKPLIVSLRETGFDLIDITVTQMENFAGNVLQLQSGTVLSRRAEDVLTPLQKEILGKRIPLDIPTLEDVGGGSARCLLAEIFLPKSG